MTLPISEEQVEVLRERLTGLCAALPEVEATRTGVAGEHSSFRVRGKNFAALWVDHHGDGRVALVAKAPRGAQADLVEHDPGRFFVPPYLGPAGWIGVRLEVGEPNWEEVDRIVRVAYREQAPARLARGVE
jgi:hypothetical protein